MTHRFNTDAKVNFGVLPLRSGFENTTSDSINVPSVGIVDVDFALFNLFDKELPLQVTVSGENNSLESKKVPIIFASGEKWALQKRKRALRDKSNTLILPLITIVRNSIVQSPIEDIAGRGTNQQTGEIVFKRQLESRDRNYQSLINRLLLNNQTNVAVNPNNVQFSDQISTLSDIGDLSEEQIIKEGGLLLPDRKKNIYEVITLPAPQFFTAKYEITIWTQHQQHMSQLIELLISSFLPQGNTWKLTTQKGYWFIAKVDENLYTSDTNFDDMSQEERTIKYKFNVSVPAYVLASNVPGAPVAVRRYVSAPTISFEVATSTEQLGIDDPFIGADDPTLPLEDGSSRRDDQRYTGKAKNYPGKNTISDNDPALLGMRRGTSVAKYKKITGVDNHGNYVVKYAKIKSVNVHTGETIFDNVFDLSQFSIIAIED